ncbi:MAG: LysM peptidoglycan-binding domain-containing protein [Tepidiformaceae bacterium]
MAEPNCHYCDREGEFECPTCGRLYCEEHGDDVCQRCMAPEAAVPSAAVYRGSVVALVVASLVAVFLLVRPPESKSSAESGRVLATATSATGSTATPTRTGSTPTRTPGAAASSSVSASPAAGTPVATPGAAKKTYTVQSGDTLSGIATANGTTVDAILALNPGLTPQALAIGALITLP